MGGKEHEQGPEKKRRNTFFCKGGVFTHTQIFLKNAPQSAAIAQRKQRPKKVSCGPEPNTVASADSSYFFWCFCIHTWKVSTRMASCTLR